MKKKLSRFSFLCKP